MKSKCENDMKKGEGMKSDFLEKKKKEKEIPLRRSSEIQDLVTLSSHHLLQCGEPIVLLAAHKELGWPFGSLIKLIQKKSISIGNRR